jgi:hypothetical protein
MLATMLVGMTAGVAAQTGTDRKAQIKAARAACDSLAGLELPVAKAKGLQHQRQFSSEDRIAPASQAEGQSAAHVTVDVEGWAILLLSPLGQHLVPQQAGVLS